jgi:hypothetical protein
MSDDIAPPQPGAAAEGPGGTPPAPTPIAAPEVTEPAPVADAATVAEAATVAQTMRAPEPAPAPAPTARAAANAPSGRSALGRVRSIMVGLVFFLTCLSLVLAATTWWLHDTVLSTDKFVALTAPLARNAEVQDALVQVTTTQVDQALDLGPVPRLVVAGIARDVYASDAFAQVWERAMRAVHKQLVAVLRGDSSMVQTSDGKVVINLFPLLDAVFQKVNSLNIEIAGRSITAPTLTNPDDPATSRAELSAALGRELKPTFGVVAVADSAKLEAAQRYVTLFDALVIILFVVTALLAILTLFLARRRVRMVALLGIGFLVALLAARLVISSAADGLATAVVDAGPGAIIGGHVVTEIAASYREFARWILLISLVAAVIATAAAWLIERRARTGAEGEGGPSVADGWFLAFAGLSIALGALLLVGLTVATFVVVLVAYVIWLVVVIRFRRRAAATAASAGPAT